MFIIPCALCLSVYSPLLLAQNTEGSKGKAAKVQSIITSLNPLFFVYLVLLSFPRLRKKRLLVSQWLDEQQRRVSFCLPCLCFFGRMPEWAHVLSKREQRGRVRKDDEKDGWKGGREGKEEKEGINKVMERENE